MILYSPKSPDQYSPIDIRITEPHAWNLSWLSADLALLPAINDTFVDCIARSLDIWLPHTKGREQVWALMERDSLEVLDGVSALYCTGGLGSFPLYAVGGTRWLKGFRQRAHRYSRGDMGQPDAPVPPPIGPLIEKFTPNGYRGQTP